MRRILPGPALVLAVVLLSAGCRRDPSVERRAEPPSAGALAADETRIAVAGTAPKPTGGFGSVVVLMPESPTGSPPVPVEPAVMDQAGNAFHPKILLVRRGQPVDFRNSEDVLHNVHVVDAETRKTIFNVGTPVIGSYRHTFDAEGAYDVSCEIHPSMAAFVFVTSSPYAAVADATGRFEIPGVPAGRYTATVWNLDPSRRGSRPVDVKAPATELDLELP